MLVLEANARHSPQVRRLLSDAFLILALCTVPLALARAQGSQPNNTGESWTATREIKTENTNPARTSESHAKSGNRSIDKQRVEVLGPDGRYQPDSDTETETIQVNDSTTRVVVRKYTWDGNGRRQLSQVTEEDAHATPNGDKQVTRTTSNSDLNGNLQVVQREVANTTKSAPDTQETKTSVYRADGNGGFSALRQTHEVAKRSSDDSLQVKKTTTLPDGNGNWQVGEVQEQTVKVDGKNRVTEERVARPNLDGKLSEVSRTVGHETESPSGEKSSTVEVYSPQVPGSSSDGSLKLTRRVATMYRKDSSGEKSEQQVEEPNLGNPGDGLQVRAKSKYVVQYAATGTQQTKTVQAPDGAGSLRVISAETQQSDRRPQPSDKPADNPPKKR